MQTIWNRRRRPSFFCAERSRNCRQHRRQTQPTQTTHYTISYTSCFNHIQIITLSRSHFNHRTRCTRNLDTDIFTILAPNQTTLLQYYYYSMYCILWMPHRRRRPCLRKFYHTCVYTDVHTSPHSKHTQTRQAHAQPHTNTNYLLDCCVRVATAPVTDHLICCFFFVYSDKHKSSDMCDAIDACKSFRKWYEMNKKIVCTISM